MQTTLPKPQATTRKDQVLRRLERTANTWVNGTELATEHVGGSEGHRRIRELRAEGHKIEKRIHPEGFKRGFQYRLTRDGGRRSVVEHWMCETCGTEARLRPQVIGGAVGLGRCEVCKSRRYFKQQ